MSKIHPSAVIEDGAQLGNDVEIGPYCVIGGKVKIKDGALLKSHVVVEGDTTIGEQCRIFPFASLGTQTQDLKFRGAETTVEIGDRTTIREYVTVNSGTNEGEITRIGNGCHIMAYVHIAHACSVGNSVIMANCATLAGDVTVEDEAIIGGLAAVHQFARVGRMCMVGGLTRVTQDCLPYMIVVGIPAEVKGLNRVGLQRRGVSADAQQALKQAYKIIYRQDLLVKQALQKVREEVPPCPEVDHLLAFAESTERGIT